MVISLISDIIVMMISTINDMVISLINDQIIRISIMIDQIVMMISIIKRVQGSTVQNNSEGAASACSIITTDCSISI